MDIEYKYLRPKKAALLKSRYEIYRDYGESRITAVSDGAVVPPYIDSHGDLIAGVVDDSGRFVVDSHCVDFPEEIEQHASSLIFNKEDKIIVYLGYFNQHWGHFITDCLSTFWFLGKIDADKYVFSCETGSPEIHPNIRLALNLLGVWDKIEIVSRPVRYRKVYVPRRGMIPRDYILKESSVVYDKIIDAASEELPDMDYPEKLILGRSQLPKAIENDYGTIEIEQFFKDNGFVAIFPEKITLVQLIGYLANAREVMVISGTLAHNMLFAPCGSRLIVIEKYPNINNYQQGIDRLKNLKVTYIDASYFIWPVSPGLGPFIMSDTLCLQSYAKDFNFTAPSPFNRDRKVLRKFFRKYYKHYKRRLISPEWLESEIGLFNEAYQESFDVFGKWLSGVRPIFLSDALRPRYIVKNLLRYIGKLRKS